MKEEAISVIVPVWNGAETIRQSVRALLAQSLPAREIIIVDDGSTDGTGDTLREFGERIRVLTRPNGGPAAARNDGIRAACGELIAFTDSDCAPDPEWLANLVSGFDEPAVGGCGGIVRGYGESLTDEYVDLIRLLDPEPDGRGEIPYLITANACFRRRALVEAGLFDEGFRRPGGEEAELCYRIRQAGYRFRLVPGARVRHRHRQSLGGLVRTLANYGEGAARIARRWPEQRIDQPGWQLLRRLIALRGWAGSFRRHWRTSDARRAFYFALLDYLRQPAFLWGYRRGSRRVKGERHHSML